MRPTHRAAAAVSAVRDVAVRVHRRTEHLPRLPFAAALAIAVVLLAAAVESGPDPADRNREVAEMALPDFGALYDELLAERPAEIEIVEYGFGVIVDPEGTERISVGAVLRNPTEGPVALGRLTVTGTGRADPPRLDSRTMAAGAEAYFGHVLSLSPDQVELDRLGLALEDPRSLVFDTDDPLAELVFGPADFERPEVRIVEVVPLAVPEGHRVVFEVEVEPTEYSHVTGLNVDLVFRDEEGRIVGGLPVDGEPFNVYEQGSRWAPEGVSVHHFDLAAHMIPADADLDRIQIGPGI
ncbi:hypothetical protein GCM10027447_25210 [Glycomyces halotolerans]